MFSSMLNTFFFVLHPHSAEKIEKYKIFDVCDMKDNVKSDTIVEMRQESQIRRPSGLRQHLQKLGSALGLEKSNRDLLTNMFSSNTNFMPVYDRVFQCEVVFSFWGFVKSDNARIKLLDFSFGSCIQECTLLQKQKRGIIWKQ